MQIQHELGKPTTWNRAETGPSLGAATHMSERVRRFLLARGEFYTLGFCEEPDLPPLRRIARAMRRHLERCRLPPYAGGLLYPAGHYAVWRQGAATSFHYSYPFNFDPSTWDRHLAACEDPQVRGELQAIGQSLGSHPLFTTVTPSEFRLGGNGYTHSIIDYRRVISEGLDGYQERVSAALCEAQAENDPRAEHLYLAMQDVLAGIHTFHRRLVDALRAAPVGASDVRRRLSSALDRVPWRPAGTFYQGLVAVNLLYYLDGCDNLGRFDQVLGDLYQVDLAAGRLSAADGEALVRLLWGNVDDNDGWNTALGGSTADGAPAYNQLTVTCLRAARGIRRPNLALRVRRDMPQPVWDVTLDAIASGCGLPALYNEDAYLDALREAGLMRETDLVDYAFGGCTETMVHGRSNVGSLDAGINLLQVLTHTLARELPSTASFEGLWAAYQADLARAIARLTDAVNRQQELKARYHPQPLRTLLIGDCLERGVEYNAGGARYNWSVINVGGIGNVVDSLAALREVVFEMREVSRATVCEALAADYRGYEWLRQRLSRCPRYGNDDPAVDDLAAELSATVFAEFARHTPWRGGRFLPACLMFVCYADAGKGVMATPDGRHADQPIADSAGPVAGRDRHGPTAMMRSVSRLDMRHAPGTLVVNIRLSRALLDGAESRAKAQDLIRGYFSLGNMQLQVNVVDQDTLQAAVADPESYRDLVVRVAGYSEYWSRLTPELRQSILERTVHSA